MDDEKTIIRVAKNADNPFVMIDRRTLESPAMSWKAKGLLAYLLSRPDNWKIRLGDLVKRSTDGEHATRSALEELKKVHHLKVERKNAEDGTFEWEYTVFEQPYGGFPYMDKPHVENRDVNNTNSNNKDLAADAAKDLSLDWLVGHDVLPDPESFETQQKQYQKLVEDAAWMIDQSNGPIFKLAVAFMLAHGEMLPERGENGFSEKDCKKWRSAFVQMNKAQPNRVLPEHVTEAVRELSRDRMTIASPFSVINKAKAIANPPKAQQETPRGTPQFKDGKVVGA